MIVKAFILSLIIPCVIFPQTILKLDSKEDWQKATADSRETEIRKAADWGGVIDLMGNGGLMLKKLNTDSLFTLTSEFHRSGEWISKWIPTGNQRAQRNIRRRRSKS